MQQSPELQPGQSKKRRKTIASDSVMKPEELSLEERGKAKRIMDRSVNRDKHAMQQSPELQPGKSKKRRKTNASDSAKITKQLSLEEHGEARRIITRTVSRDKHEESLEERGKARRIITRSVYRDKHVMQQSPELQPAKSKKRRMTISSASVMKPKELSLEERGKTRRIMAWSAERDKHAMQQSPELQPGKSKKRRKTISSASAKKPKQLSLEEHGEARRIITRSVSRDKHVMQQSPDLQPGKSKKRRKTISSACAQKPEEVSLEECGKARRIISRSVNRDKHVMQQSPELEPGNSKTRRKTISSASVMKPKMEMHMMSLLTAPDEEKDYLPSTTTLNELPLEMLDVVLMKSFLRWMLHSSKHQRDEDIIRTLTSVDFCWFKRITKRRFKKRIWKQLKDIYGRISANIRNNRNYLLANIKLNSTLIDSLLSFNCLTEEQSHFIQRQRSYRHKNTELLQTMRSWDFTKFPKFLTCLRQANQKTVAKILENGGGLQ